MPCEHFQSLLTGIFQLSSSSISQYFMVNDITILLLYALFSRNHGYRLDICETVTSQPLSEYFSTFKINIVDICKIMLMELTISDL